MEDNRIYIAHVGSQDLEPKYFIIIMVLDKSRNKAVVRFPCLSIQTRYNKLIMKVILIPDIKNMRCYLFVCGSIMQKLLNL